jgi:hypothetical protein
MHFSTKALITHYNIEEQDQFSVWPINSSAEFQNPALEYRYPAGKARKRKAFRPIGRARLNPGELNQ